MGTVSPFRIKGGLDLDGKVQFQVFPSAPSGDLADKLSVGSLGVAQDSGQWYRKITIGAGPDKWAALTTSADLIGVAPNWLPPVDAVITQPMTLEDAREAALNLSENRQRVLFPHLLDANPAIYDVGFYPPASVPLDPLGVNPGGSPVYHLRSTLPGDAPTSADNAMTFVATTNNPLNATETTCTITGNAIAVNLKNSGGTSTAKVLDVLRAIEAVDTANRVRAFCPDYTAEEIANGIDPNTPQPAVGLTTFSGGGSLPIGFEPVPMRTIKGETSQNHYGDTVYVQDGTEEGAVYSFNSDGQWVKQGHSNTMEAGYIQGFIGKTGDGAEMPNYASSTVITQNGDLENAIGELDAETGRILGWLGKSTGEENPLYLDPVAITQGANLHEAVNQLDQEIGYLLAFVGKDAGNDSPNYPTTRIVGQGTSLETALGALDERLGAVSHESHTTAVTSLVTADSILMEQELAAEWIIHAREVANPGNVYVTRVVAAHNADIGVPATQATFNESAIIELGQPIDGFAITMDVEVVGALNARTMRLRMASGVPVDVTMNRAILRRAA